MFAKVTGLKLFLLMAAFIAPALPAYAQQAQVFARGSDGALWHFDGAHWNSLGDQIVGDPDACSWGPDRVDVFARGANNTLRQIARVGGKWTQWYDLGGELTSSPSCVSWGNNRIDVFARGADGSLAHKAWDGKRWVDWVSLGGELPEGASPDAASWGADRIDVFVRGTDAALWQKAWVGTKWADWVQLGGKIASDPGAVSWGPNRIDIFALGTDGQMWQIAWDGTRWTQWYPQGGSFDAGSSPDAASTGANRLEVFARGTDSALWSKVWDGSRWREWTRLGGALASDPGAVAMRGDASTAANQNYSVPPDVKGQPTPTPLVNILVTPRIDPVAILQPTPTPNPAIIVQPIDPVAILRPSPTPPLVDPRLLEQVASGGCIYNPNSGAVITDGWDFETGLLQGWTAEGDAFSSLRQPTLGDNVTTDRVITNMRLDAGGIGGDYWKKIPYPIGHQGQYWIGTFENHPTPTGPPLGSTVGNAPIGSLTSPKFCLDKPFISFLIGGGRDAGHLWIELLLRASAAEVAERQNGGQMLTVDGEQYFSVVSATGLLPGETMSRAHFDVSRYRGRIARLRIVDNSATGHINIDDIKMADSQPAASKPPIWGFVDTHTHPSNYLAFGGGLIQGKLYSPDGNPASALPYYLGNVDAAKVGAVGILAAPIMTTIIHSVTPYGTLVPPVPPDPVLGATVAAGIFGSTAPNRRGFPEHTGYPKFNNGLGQQMYKDWIKRAYDGGLRLMSALAINNWLVSSHSTKNFILGTSAPIDDRASADAQIADIKRWVNEIENRRWVEIANSPEDARRIIGENKLAVLLGVELDLLGNFAPNNAWGSDQIVVLDPEPATEAAVQRVRQLVRDELERLHRMGVRQITPYHYVSGSFGGSAMFERLFNEQNRKFTGRNVVVEGGAQHGVHYRLDNDSPGLLDQTIREVVTGHQRDLHSDPSWVRTRGGHINAMGLTKTGEILFEEVARLGMIMDIDHASYKTANALLKKAEDADYPLLSSHSDFVDLAITGPWQDRSGNGEFRPGNDAANLDRFGTTLHGNIGHEGMSPRSKFERISSPRVGGMISPIVSTYRRAQHRRSAGRTIVPNDNEGSSKTWAQLYLYATDIAPGRGVGMATDRGMINFIAPRFGPNSAFMLGSETHESLSRRLRSSQVEAQTHGVRYDTPLNWRTQRFSASGESAYEYTGKAKEHEDAWIAMAAFKAGRNPWAMSDAEREEFRSGPGHNKGRVENFVRGLFAGQQRNEALLESDCRQYVVALHCGGNTIGERYAAYAVGARITPGQLTRWSNDANVVEHYGWMERVWRHWHSIVSASASVEPQGDPLKRHVFGSRDFDVNIDGVAHYGMLPDFLQDLKNVGLKGEDFSPLFKSAEQYVQMWEKAQERSAALRR